MNAPRNERRIIQAARDFQSGRTDARDGPRLAAFDPRLVALALEHELDRARAMGWTRIDVSMTLDDAAKLAHYLKGKR